MLNFGIKLRAYRKEKGYTQTDIANMFNTTQAAVGRWENGISSPPYETLVKLSNILEFSIDQLLDTDFYKRQNPRILELFNNLNDAGKEEGIKRLEEISNSSKYAKEKINTISHSFNYKSIDEFFYDEIFCKRLNDAERSALRQGLITEMTLLKEHSTAFELEKVMKMINQLDIEDGIAEKLKKL